MIDWWKKIYKVCDLSLKMPTSNNMQCLFTLLKIRWWTLGIPFNHKNTEIFPISFRKLGASRLIPLFYTSSTQPILFQHSYEIFTDCYEQISKSIWASRYNSKVPNFLFAVIIQWGFWSSIPFLLKNFHISTLAWVETNLN